MGTTVKSIAPRRVQVKNADAGEVEAVFATLKTIDSDGDVILPGAIDDGTQVVVSAYMHESWKGKLPVGRGTIHEVGDELVVKAQFFLDTTHGADTFGTVKGLAGIDDGDDNLGEWSFSLQDVVATKSKWEGKTANVISQIGTVKEVSPVFQGAGVNTRTLSVKADTKQLASSLRRLLADAGRERFPNGLPLVADYDPDEGYVVFDVLEGDTVALYRVEFTATDTAVTLGDEQIEVHETATFVPKAHTTFAEHIKSVMADVNALADRAEEVVALRAAKGKSLGDESATGIADLAAALKRFDDISAPDTESNPAAIDVDAEFLRFAAFTHGVTT